MNQYYIIGTAVVIIIIVAYFIGQYISTLHSKTLINIAQDREKTLQKQLEELKNQHKDTEKKWEDKFYTLETEKDDLAFQLAQKITSLQMMGEKLSEQKQEVEQLNQKFQKEFENLANKILEEKSEKFTLQNKTNLDHLITPLKEKIKEFEQKVDHSHKESITNHASLKQQIQDLSKLNEKITQEAHNLALAIKGDNKVQGNWGEFILESILEKSGLQKDREYFAQNQYSTDSGFQKPDVIIKLPENKFIIIDSKMSLKEYENYFNTEIIEDKELHLALHLKSIKNHIKLLGEKKYQNIEQLKTLDFILMFIPIEPAFSLAVQKDTDLFNYALEKNIVLVSPTTLLATLRTIASIWKHEYQNQNVIEIANKAGALYDKFVNLLNDLEKVGLQLNTVQKTYVDSMKKLTGRGNLIKNIEDIKALGANASKQIEDKWLNKEG